MDAAPSVTDLSLYGPSSVLASEPIQHASHALRERWVADARGATIVNVRVPMTQAAMNQTVASARAEHISIESALDDLGAPARQPRRKVRSTYALRSKLRGCETELSILDDHYLAVRIVRPHAEPKKYEIDLRFASAKPIRMRHVSWFWLMLALGLVLLGSGALWSVTIPVGRWANPIFLSALGTLGASLAALFMFLRRTVESLEFLSAHGEARLVSVTGGIGSARAGKKFFIELIKNINAAKAARPQPRQQFLRDEMREHHRLRELGVLSQEEYEASKTRILGAH